MVISPWQVLGAVIVVIFTWFLRAYLKARRARKICNWLPHTARWPVVGSLFEFGGPTETLSDVTRITDNVSKMAYTEVSYMSNIISRDYDFVEFIMSSNTLLDKSRDYEFLHVWLGTGLLTSTGAKWKKRRRVLTPAFHFSILEQFVDVFDTNANTLVQKLERECLHEDGVDVYRYVTACALDSICETAMGVKIDSQKDKNQEYVMAVQQMCRLLVDRIFSIWKSIEILFRLTPGYRQQGKYLKILHKFTSSVIDQRINELRDRGGDGLEKDDALGRKRKLAFLDLLLNATIDGKPLSKQDIREEVDTFMFEGHDTTSSAVSSALFLLANHPQVQTLARNEQKNIFGKHRNRPTTLQDLNEMKYLEMAIKETLRIYPAVPLVGRYTTEDVPYKDHIIPKNTLVTISIYGLNHDPDYFENPEQFNPERFLNTSSERPYSFIPFSAGPRNCIGQKFAMLEMKSILSKILQNFELTPTDPPHELQLSSELVLKSLNGFKMKLRKCVWDAV